MIEEEPDNVIAAKRITFTERFEKTRLAVMAYGGVAIVLSVATTETTGVAPGLPGSALDFNVIRALLLFACTTYFVVFILFDVPSSRTLNRNIFYNVDWKDIPNRISEIEKNLLDETKQISMLEAKRNEARQHYLDVIQNLRSKIDEINSRNLLQEIYDKYKEEIDATNSLISALQIKGKANLTGLPHDWWKPTVQDYVKKIGLITEEVKDLTFEKINEISIDDYSDILTVELDQMQSVFHKLKQYSSEIAASEIRRFRIWDIGAPILVWVSTLVFVTCSVWQSQNGYHWIWLEAPTKKLCAKCAPTGEHASQKV